MLAVVEQHGGEGAESEPGPGLDQDQDFSSTNTGTFMCERQLYLRSLFPHPEGISCQASAQETSLHRLHRRNDGVCTDNQRVVDLWTGPINKSQPELKLEHSETFHCDVKME